MNNSEALEKQYRALANKLVGLVKPTGEVVSSMDKISKVLNRRSKTLEIQNIWNQLYDIVERLNNWGSLQLPRFNLDDDYFNDLVKSVISISKLGWYFNYGSIPRHIFQANEFIQNSDESGLDDFMCEILENEVEELKIRIMKNFSPRKHILNAAFKAHQSEDYYLSIPVFLSQIDGITHDILNKHFFIKPEKIIKWANERGDDDISKFMFAALNEITIFQAESQPHDRNSISRHAILHGGNLSYGTKVNGFKVLSLLAYTTDVITLNSSNFK